MTGILILLIILLTLGNLTIMLAMNIYNCIDTIKTAKEHKRMEQELDTLMKDTLARLEKVNENKEEE